MHELGPSGTTDQHEGDELLGQDLDLTVKLIRATDLPTDKFTDFQCRFSFRNHTPHKTEKVTHSFCSLCNTSMRY
jgi:hypothetical protein